VTRSGPCLGVGLAVCGFARASGACLVRGLRIAAGCMRGGGYRDVKCMCANADGWRGGWARMALAIACYGGGLSFGAGSVVAGAVSLVAALQPRRDVANHSPRGVGSQLVSLLIRLAAGNLSARI